MIALGIQLIVAHHSAATCQKHILERLPVAANIAKHRTDASPLRGVMQFVTDVHRQFAANTQSEELMVYVAALHIYVIRQPRMCQTAFDLKVPVATGERHVPVNAY